MSDEQAWLTYAGDDQEGIKAIVLGRTLRKTITRRKIFVVVAEKVSKKITELLRDEFDCCLHVSNEEWDEKFNGLPFPIVAKLQCWRLKRIRKFVFLDCNCIVIKNSDALFKTDANCLQDIALDVLTAPVFVGKSEARTSKKFQKIVVDIIKELRDQDVLDQDKPFGLQNKYCVQVDFNQKHLMTGEELKIVNVGKFHPLDLILDFHEDILKNFSAFQKHLIIFCLDLMPMNLLSCVYKNRNGALQDNINVIKNLVAIPPTITKEIEDFDYLKDSIAIVGMSFRFPGANTIDEFWELLINGGDGIIRVPEGRWNKDQCFIKQDNTNDTQAGFLKCPIDTIDGKFFGLNAAELAYMDPQQRLCLQVVYESLENAGLCASGLKETLTGVFGGWWRNDYKEMLQEAGLNETEFFRAYMGNALGTVTGRISHFLELTGPSISTESGCSTSIVAVDMACNSLKEENCDVALAIGINLLLHPFSIDAMNAVVAMDGHCKTFDAQADGFGRAEGCAVLVLKRFADAATDGDKIWGVIRGSAVVQEGPSKSLGTPTVQCEALAMELALERAGVEPSEVSFVETHGTGTPVGDPLEVAAIAKAYGKDRGSVLTIGSVKTNIGHTESVSGIAGIVKTILSLQNEMIPKHLNLEILNPEINLDIIPAQIPLEAMPWKKVVDRPRIAGVSSFGITGTDAHVIIQEAPNLFVNYIGVKDQRPEHIITISAKSQEGLAAYLDTYKTYFENTSAAIEDIEFSLHTKRDQYPYRAAIIGKTKKEIQYKLQQKTFETQQTEALPPKVCFLFTGQGSQYPKMGKELYDNSLVFQTHFDYCDNILTNHYGFSIKHVIWESDAHALSRTLYSQTSIFIVEYCLLKLWQSWGVTPDCVLGHSLGEFAAAVAAGILSIQDAIKLVVTRSKLIDSLPQGNMLVVNESLIKTEQLLKEAFQGTNSWLDIAAVNTQQQTVLAGETKNIKTFAEFCDNNHIKIHHLAATHAFHSRSMDSILEKYRTVANEIIYTTNENQKYISGMEGKIMESKQICAEYWVRHTREKVSFISAAKVAIEAENTIFLEIGPQPVLSAMMITNVDLVENVNNISCTPSLRKNTSEWETILNSLGTLYLKGVNINWQNFHRYTNGNKVDLPSYPFKLKPYWMELNQNETTPIHPLLGCPIPNPSSNKLFHSNINVDRLTFLKDHVVGNKMIFPGAGFLELCLASGHSAIQGTNGNYFPPHSAMTIDNFQIEAPLGLSENGLTHLQVVVSNEDSGETKTTIHSKLVLDKETNKWIKHASGVFSPFASPWEGQMEFEKDGWEKTKLRCNDKVVTDFSYNKLEQFGMKFGETFQSIKEFWKGDKEGYVVIKTPNDNHRYILHPVVIDAMFQALMIFINPDSNEIHVPISIQKFAFYHNIEDKKELYIYCKTINLEANEHIAILVDGSGKQLAAMVGAEFIETSVSNLMSLIESQRRPYPSMYKEVWRTKFGPFERRVPEDEMCAISINTASVIRKAQSSLEFNILAPERQYFLQQSNRLCALYMMKALLNLKLSPYIGQIINLEQFSTACKVVPKLTGMLRYMLMELAKEGYFQILSNGDQNLVCEVICHIPSLSEISSEIETLKILLSNIDAVEVSCISTTGDVLADILNGNTSALAILFPGDNIQGPAEQYYKNSLLHLIAQETLEGIGKINFSFIHDNRKTPKSIIRILEIGAGTGAFTESLLPHLLLDGASHYEYTFTDISQIFFSSGESIFKDSNMKVNYKVLNIEEDPTSQGFIPNHYDMIFAGYVLHATTDILRVMMNIKKLLTNGGYFLLLDLTEPHRSTNLMFGVLDGFWSFTDTELRPFKCELGVEKWQELLEGVQFSNVSTLSFFNSHCGIIFGNKTNSSEVSHALENNCIDNQNKSTWIIFSDSGNASVFYTKKLERLGKRTAVIKLEEYTSWNYRNEKPPLEDPVNAFLESFNEGHQIEGILYFWGLDLSSKNVEVVHPFFDICRFLSNKEEIKLLLFTHNAVGLEDGSRMTSIKASPTIAMAKVLQNENVSLFVKTVDLNDESKNESLEEGFSEIFTSDGEFIVVYRNNQRYVPRLTHWKPPQTALTFPASRLYRLLLPSSLEIDDLKFVSLELPLLKDDQVEINVKTYGLNFRDLFSIMKPDPVFENLNTVGIDYAGVVSAAGKDTKTFKIGDRVFGVNLKGGAMPSHVQVKESAVIHIPETMTFCEAATCPAVGATAYMCLIEIAKLDVTDTVLIHAASGGVGLCAVQIAKSKGCTIIATAGSERKRNFLKEMGIKHVFHSRNTDYAKHIRDALNGNGVDVVLNSLTSEGFKEATLAVCNQNARFIEMSKMSIWSENEVKVLRPDLKYTIVDLSLMSDQEIAKYTHHVTDLVLTSGFKPLPYVKFDASEIRSALLYLQEAKHIGKVVCVMPEHSTSSSETQFPLFNHRSCYMITGGLGGIGLEVANWMANSGAKHIILVGRNPPTKNAEQKIEGLLNRNIHVKIMNCDIGNRNQCRDLLERIKTEGLPPLRGIMHAAGILSDGLFLSQTWESFENVLHPKVKGGWNLHELTKDFPLEFFVMFSSVTVNVGNIGQSNHVAANYFLDTLACYRKSIGLPAISINWGQWGQVGVAADIDLIGLRPFSNMQAFCALDKIMRSQETQITVVEADLNLLLKRGITTKKYFSELKAKDSDNILIASIDSEQFWKEYDSAETRDDKFKVVRSYVCNLIRIKMKMDPSEIIDDNANFQESGMDSLMMIEMKNALQSSVGKRAKITINAVRDCKTVAQLSHRIVELLSGVEEVPVPTKEELIELILEDSVLPENIKPKDEKILPPSEIRTVLITGVTGNFGPYVLRELSERPNINKIYCLMRDNRLFSPKERLKQMLHDKQLLHEINMDKVECFFGDVAKSKLGIAEELYKELASTVDAVFNLSVKASISDYYCKSEHKNSSRVVNVLGTKEILHFACDAKTKFVFHASTTISTKTSDDDGSFSETWPVEGEFDNEPNCAYSISKYICDRLISQAVERGIPCKVFRFPFMGGDSKLGGNISILDNHLLMRMLGYMHLGFMAARNMPIMIVPVDVCAELSLKIFFHDDTPCDIYNVSNPFVEDELLLEEYGKEFGCSVEVVETDEFFKRIENLEGKNAEEIKAIANMTRPEDIKQLERNPPAVYVAWLAGEKNIFLSQKLCKWLPPQYPKCMKPAWEILKKDLKYAKESGVIDKIFQRK